MSDAEPPVLPRTLGLRDLLLLKLVAIINVSLVAPVAVLRPGFASAVVSSPSCSSSCPRPSRVLTFARRYPGEGGIYLWTAPNSVRCTASSPAGATGSATCSTSRCSWSTLAGVLAFTTGGESAGLVDAKWFVAAVAFGWLRARHRRQHPRPRRGQVAAERRIAGDDRGARPDRLGRRVGRRAGRPVRALRGGVRWQALSGLSVMCFAFMGLELASTNGQRDAASERDLPRAALAAGAVTLVAYLALTWALQRCCPRGHWRHPGRVRGRAGGGPLRHHVADWSARDRPGGIDSRRPVGMVRGSTRIPFVAGFGHALPEALGRVHPRWGSPYVALVTQGCAVVGVHRRDAGGLDRARGVPDLPQVRPWSRRWCLSATCSSG